MLAPSFYALNKLTINDKIHILVIDDLLDGIHDAKFFTKLDLHSRYYQKRMNDVNIPKKTFYTHEGHHDFLVMPFGLCNAPFTFHNLMNNIIWTFFCSFLLAIFNDIFIHIKTWEIHGAC
jgi:hypothetical protein